MSLVPWQRNQLLTGFGVFVADVSPFLLPFWAGVEGLKAEGTKICLEYRKTCTSFPPSVSCSPPSRRHFLSPLASSPLLPPPPPPPPPHRYPRR
ncbi:hypothetical protein BC936DRAFT_142021, partial [Jimgerdemannia flammicorona]